MAYLEELLPELRKGAKIRRKDWDKGKYIVCDGTFVYNDLDRIHSLTNSDITGNVWELYQESEPDWDYIIKNKCLCWFWDMGDEEESKKAGILAYYDYDNSQFRRYGSDNYTATWFDHCRPVRRYEVTFYEDRKDE